MNDERPENESLDIAAEVWRGVEAIERGEIVEWKPEAMEGARSRSREERSPNS